MPRALPSLAAAGLMNSPRAMGCQGSLKQRLLEEPELFLKAEEEAQQRRAFSVSALLCFLGLSIAVMMVFLLLSISGPEEYSSSTLHVPSGLAHARTLFPLTLNHTNLCMETVIRSAPTSRLPTPLRGSPLNLLVAERHPLLASKGVAWFPDIEQGVSYMARYVADPKTAQARPEMKAFWSGLLEKERVHRIFGPDRNFHTTPPNDLSIVTLVAMLQVVSQYGTNIASKDNVTLTAAAVVTDGYEGVFVVRVSPGRSPVLQDAWTIDRLVYQNTTVDAVIVFLGAYKRYDREGFGDILTYQALFALASKSQ